MLFVEGSYLFKFTNQDGSRQSLKIQITALGNLRSVALFPKHPRPATVKNENNTKPEHENAEEAPQLTQTVEEKVQIITFDDDQAVVSQPVPNPVSIPILPGISHTDMDNHSVVSFLQRSQLLSSFRWQTSATRSQNLYRLPSGNAGGLLIPTHLISRTMAKNKLDGFTSFKAKAVIELKINSQPFQCGRLIMAAAPMPSLLGSRKDFIFSHVANTQNIHHVQMDIAKDTSVKLEIPFISPYNCFDLIEGKFDWAELQILVYSPLNSINGECVECNVYGWFEDIQLGAPTSGEVNIVQQSASSGAVDNTRKKESTGRMTGALAQLGNTLVSKALTTVSPILSVGDSILAAAGWSKPILSKPSQVVLNRPEEGFAYMDGVDQSQVLAMTASNSVEAMPGLVGTGIDETDFHRLKRIPQMIGVFKYSNNVTGTPACSSGANLGDTVPKLLWSCAVAPTCNVPACYNVTVPPDSTTGIVNPYTLNWKQPTTLNYITSPFLYWTGSLVYTFKFVKTDYHSGRVEISFHPFVNTLNPRNDPNWLADRMDYVYRTVVDLRKNSEVSVTIPYIAAQPWKRVSTYLDPVNPNPPSPGRAKDLITGILAVRALTPLFSTQTVPPTIEVLVEMRAGDDYECQGPITSKFLPFSFGNVEFPNQSTRNDIVQQSGAFALRTGAITRQMYFIWNTTNASDKIRTISGLSGVKYVGIDIFATVFQFSDVSSSWRWQIRFSWDENRPVQFGRNDRNMDVHYYVSLENTDNRDDLTIAFEGIAIQPASNAGNCRCLLDINVYPITSSTSSNIVSIDPASLPLQVELNQDKGPLVTTIEEQPIEVEITKTQLPLPCAIQGSGGIQEVRLTSSQIPLPVQSEGGGGGGTVTINPDQLPLWCSDYNVAPLDPRKEKSIIQQSGGDFDKFAASGITETRSNALEGWMPPSITQVEQDAHRPSTTQYCAGERFTTFRQYSRRFAFCLVNGLDSSKMFKIQPVELIRPGILSMRVTPGVQPGNDRTQFALYAPNTGAEVSASPLSFVAGMFAFYRGSVRFKAWMDPRENPPNLISGHLEYNRQIADVNVIDDNIENFMTPIAYETPLQKQIAEFQVPYYSPTVVSSTWSHGIDSQFDTPLCNLVLSIPDFRQNTNNFPIKVAVAAGDDMDFHQFIGPPPVINVGDLLTVGRQLHYPPTGFTPTQKVAADTSRTDEPATRFVRVQYNRLTVSGNPTGGSCPAPQMVRRSAISPTPVTQARARSPNPPPLVRQQRQIFYTPVDGRDEVDELNSRILPPNH